MTIHENSRVSYEEEKKSGSSERFRRSIWGILHDSKLSSFTDRELMILLNEDDFNNIRPEITRLKQDGLIKENGKVICQYTHKKVRTCKINSEQYLTRGQVRSLNRNKLL